VSPEENTIAPTEQETPPDGMSDVPRMLTDDEVWWVWDAKGKFAGPLTQSRECVRLFCAINRIPLRAASGASHYVGAACPSGAASRLEAREATCASSGSNGKEESASPPAQPAAGAVTLSDEQRETVQELVDALDLSIPLGPDVAAKTALAIEAGRALLAAGAAPSVLSEQDRSDLRLGACVFRVPPYDRNPQSQRIADLMERLAADGLKSCRGDPGECKFNGACMYACGVKGRDDVQG
jgi:hypothetical protein